VSLAVYLAGRQNRFQVERFLQEIKDCKEEKYPLKARLLYQGGFDYE